MTTPLSTVEKSYLLVEYEQQQARKLARKVIDKPKPPLWMILIPVFFVFFAWKMKAYKDGIKTFCQKWMIARERCVHTALLALENKTEPDIAEIVRKSSELPPEVMGEYTEWITLLTSYYMQLLSADGNNIDEMIRRHFHTKSNYLLTLKQIDRIANKYHRALLPFMPGDQEDLAVIIEKINNWSLQLQKDHADILFP